MVSSSSDSSTRSMTLLEAAVAVANALVFAAGVLFAVAAFDKVLEVADELTEACWPSPGDGEAIGNVDRM